MRISPHVLTVVSLLLVATLGHGQIAPLQTSNASKSTAEPTKVVVNSPLAIADHSPKGTVSGVAKFEGKPPKMRKIKPSSDPACEKMHGGEDMRAETVVVNEDGTLRNVFVWVSKGLEGKEFPAPKEAAVLDQQKCRFEPHVLGVQVGQTIDIKNSDPTTHNVHALPKLNKSFNFSQSKQNSVQKVSFKRKEIAVYVKCDIHPWMGAYVAVVDNPFHAVTGDGGKFDLKDLPAGTYTISAWHEKYGTQTKEVKVGDGATEKIEFTFKKKKRRRRGR